MMRRLGLLTSVLIVSPLAAQTDHRLPSADRPLAVRVETAYRVGGASAAEWASFGRIDEVGFDAGGRLYVLDGRNSRVVVIGANGEHLRTIGRRGQGPGEFMAARQMAVVRDGGVVVHDVSRNNFQRFGPNGELIGEAPTPREIGSPDVFLMVDGTTAVATPRVFVLDGRLALASDLEAGPPRSIPLYRLEVAAGGGATKIGSAWLAPRPNRGSFSPHAFAPSLHAAGVGGVIAIVDSVAYDVRVIDRDGAVTLRIRRPLAPREPTRADRERARSEARARLIAPDGRPRVAGANAGGGAPQQSDLIRQIEAGLRDMAFADRIPVVTGLRADPDGRLWVARVGEVWGEAGPIDVIAPGGRYLGTVRPGDLRLPDALGPGGLAAFIETDALGAPVIVVRRVRFDGLDG